MLRTLPQTRDNSLTRRIIAVVAFAALTAITARVQIYFGSPVPFSLSVLTVLLSGMVLGATDGAISQLLYIAMLGANLPVAAGGVGSAAFAGPTAGYILAYIPAAFIVGFLTERGQTRLWQRWAAALVGIAVIYILGATFLKLFLNADWGKAWALGVAPFIAVDLAKAVIAASLAEGGRALLMRNQLPR